MTKHLTLISTPGVAAVCERGTKDVQFMISAIRAHAEHLYREANLISNTADEDFHVKVVDGVIVERLVTVLQEGNSRSAERVTANKDVVSAALDLIQTTLETYVAYFPASRHPVGAPGSYARSHQEQIIALEDAARESLKMLARVKALNIRMRMS